MSFCYKCNYLLVYMCDSCFTLLRLGSLLSFILLYKESSCNLSIYLNTIQYSSLTPLLCFCSLSFLYFILLLHNIFNTIKKMFICLIITCLELFFDVANAQLHVSWGSLVSPFVISYHLVTTFRKVWLIQGFFGIINGFIAYCLLLSRYCICFFFELCCWSFHFLMVV